MAGEFDFFAPTPPGFDFGPMNRGVEAGAQLRLQGDQATAAGVAALGRSVSEGLRRSIEEKKQEGKQAHKQELLKNISDPELYDEGTYNRGKEEFAAIYAKHSDLRGPELNAAVLADIAKIVQERSPGLDQFEAANIATRYMEDRPYRHLKPDGQARVAKWTSELAGLYGELGEDFSDIETTIRGGMMGAYMDREQAISELREQDEALLGPPKLDKRQELMFLSAQEQGLTRLRADLDRVGREVASAQDARQREELMRLQIELQSAVTEQEMELQSGYRIRETRYRSALGREDARFGHVLDLDKIAASGDQARQLEAERAARHRQDMAVAQQYELDKMGEGFHLDVEKIAASGEQSRQLEELRSANHRQDMAVAQQYDLDRMGEGFHYNMMSDRFKSSEQRAAIALEYSLRMDEAMLKTGAQDVFSATDQAAFERVVGATSSFLSKNAPTQNMEVSMDSTSFKELKPAESIREDLQAAGWGQAEVEDLSRVKLYITTGEDGYPTIGARVDGAAPGSVEQRAADRVAQSIAGSPEELALRIIMGSSEVSQDDLHRFRRVMQQGGAGFGLSAATMRMAGMTQQQGIAPPVQSHDASGTRWGN